VRRDPASVPVQDVGNAFVVVIQRVMRRFPHIDIQDHVVRRRMLLIARRLVADSPADPITWYRRARM
jgi:hypothetical protein